MYLRISAGAARPAVITRGCGGLHARGVCRPSSPGTALRRPRRGKARPTALCLDMDEGLPGEAHNRAGLSQAACAPTPQQAQGLRRCWGQGQLGSRGRRGGGQARPGGFVFKQERKLAWGSAQQGGAFPSSLRTNAAAGTGLANCAAGGAAAEAKPVPAVLDLNRNEGLPGEAHNRAGLSQAACAPAPQRAQGLRHCWVAGAIGWPGAPRRRDSMRWAWGYAIPRAPRQRSRSCRAGSSGRLPGSASAPLLPARG